MMQVEQIRGGVVESSHTVHAAVVDREGRLVARAGDPDLVTFWRSAAKPFQAVPLVTDGVVERFKISTAELAQHSASSAVEILKRSTTPSVTSGTAWNGFAAERQKVTRSGS